MADTENRDGKRPGEKAEGKYHYNPGNQSAKPAEILKPESERVNNPDKKSGSDNDNRKR